MASGGALEWLVVAVAIPVALLIYKWLAVSRERRFPPGPPTWPIIGHAHLLVKGNPHQTLAELAARHGPLMGLRLGSSQRAVIVSSPALARTFLTTHDHIFANRPALECAVSLFYGINNDLLFTSLGPQLRKLRKLCTTDLFGPKRMQLLQQIRKEEVSNLIQRISDTSPSAVDIGRFTVEMTSCMLSRLLVSRKELKKGDYSNKELLSIVKHVEEETGPCIGDLFPWMKWLDFVYRRRSTALHARMDAFFNSVLADRKEAMLSLPSHEIPPDFLTSLLSPSEDHEKLTPSEIKGLLIDILLAGILTSAYTLEWGMAELFRSPQCLTKLQKELEEVIGKGKQVHDSDLPKLTYLKQVVKEVFRLHPGVPLLTPRVSSQACEVDGYTLPANTHLYVNTWAIGRDENVWQNPNTFLPERFEDKDMDVKGQHYELLPFGSGRRMCLGMAVGLSTVELTLANLVNRFDWALPPSCTHVDMAEVRGMVASKATAMCAILSPFPLPL